MKQFRRCQRILILSLLFLSVLAPLVFVSYRLKNLASVGRKEFIEDLATIKYRRDDLRLKAIQQEGGEGLKEPLLVVYKDKDQNSTASYSSSEDIRDLERSVINGDTTNAVDNRNETDNEKEERDEQVQQRGISNVFQEKGQFNSQLREITEERTKEMRDLLHNKEAHHDRNVHTQLQKVTDEKIREMKDQLIRAKAYLSFAPPGSNSHLVKELRLRIKEVERALGERTKDSELSRSALQKMRHMETSLSKASAVYPDCSAMAAKLRAMAHTTEEQVRSQKKQAAYLVHIAARSTPKGLHCLAMRLTAEYFALEPEERQLPKQQKLKNLHDQNLYHYVVFSDNILACAVVVSSTVSAAAEPKKIVFHVVTDSLNFPAISMWFILNPPGKATIQIQSIDNFGWLFTKYNNPILKQESSDSRFTFQLNHLRFYLPEIFPALNKVVLFDHDVVVLRDLTGLWHLDMKGKVVGAVQTCQKGKSSYRQMDTFLNFSDPFVAKSFDINACTWAFGLNLFDLQVWRKQNLTAVYHRYLQMGSERPLWMAGSLPLGWVTFYKKTVALDRRWHITGLGYDSELVRGDIERAAVLHYDGIMKPWLDIAIGKYKQYWNRFVKFEHPYLQQCNIHE
ncbi:probable galacturonosyltransferase 6 isoform X2 [Humulus lupulus]|uniref:probable galacturonosyltransferase 6 isoform X2 n=1 Tax=Humulus lupulus TaxID=3486 RepID=UPI002B40B7A6|nr:probable galacturonosyltransferase 6 isoform X2 [Humulus lupulus]